MDMLHASHKSRKLQTWNAKQLWYWAEMKRDIAKKTDSCDACQTHIPQRIRQPQPQLPVDTLKFNPIECFQLDIYEIKKRNYITCVDKTTGLILSKKLSNKEKKATVKALKKIFLKINMPFLSGLANLIIFI